ncbi:MAG: hypothetical protein GF311_05595 [Candidatus Lokiarchaeota archaeon]|nr:hypothetical protein [Candidatus Lokiarchaeota archaeon]
MSRVKKNHIHTPYYEPDNEEVLIFKVNEFDLNRRAAPRNKENGTKFDLRDIKSPKKRSFYDRAINNNYYIKSSTYEKKIKEVKEILDLIIGNTRLGSNIRKDVIESLRRFYKKCSEQEIKSKFTHPEYAVPLLLDYFLKLRKTVFDSQEILDYVPIQENLKGARNLLYKYKIIPGISKKQRIDYILSCISRFQIKYKLPKAFFSKTNCILKEELSRSEKNLTCVFLNRGEDKSICAYIIAILNYEYSQISLKDIVHFFGISEKSIEKKIIELCKKFEILSTDEDAKLNALCCLLSRQINRRFLEDNREYYKKLLDGINHTENTENKPHPHKSLLRAVCIDPKFLKIIKSKYPDLYQELILPVNEVIQSETNKNQRIKALHDQFYEEYINQYKYTHARNFTIIIKRTFLASFSLKLFLNIYFYLAKNYDYKLISDKNLINLNSFNSTPDLEIYEFYSGKDPPSML